MAGNVSWRNRDWGNTPVRDDNCDDLRHRRISVLEHNDAGDPLDEDEVPRIDTSGGGAERWLNSDVKWEKRFPAGWKGVKVLGAGGFGIAGHWKYVSDVAPAPGSIESQVRDIVVKQTRAAVDNGLRYESKFLENLTSTGSRHFPKLYGRVQRDVGTGTELAIDPHRREVHRIFLEYCPGGSLYSNMQNFKKTRQQGDQMPEAALWSIFHCLAKAISVMDMGHENDKRVAVADGLEPWIKNEGIVHFDLKPGNVLVGSRDGGEHEVWERVMVADFGLSALIPRAWTHDIETLSNHEGWGTVVFQAPEQLRHPVGRKAQLRKLDRKYGACTNIYQVGTLMWALIIELPGFRFDNIGDCYISPLTGKKKFETIGKQIEQANYYSKALRGLILECLFQVCRNRPTPSELIKRTRLGLSVAEGEGDTASSRAAKASAKSTLQQIDTLLLESWHGPYQDHRWRKIIPRMQTVVNRRNRQIDQIYTARLMHTDEELSRKAAEAAEAAKQADAAKEAEAAEAAKQADAAKEAEAARIERVSQLRLEAARARLPQGAGDRLIGTPGPGRASRLVTSTVTSAAAFFTGTRASTFAANLVTTAGELANAVQPHVATAVRDDLAPVAASAWQIGMGVAGIGMGVAGRLGLVEKRRSDEDAGREATKRARLDPFQGVEQPPPVPQPGDPGFLVQVKIWPGEYASVANESRTITKTFKVPGRCTVAMLKQILSTDGVANVNGVPTDRIKLVAKGDFAREMRDASPLTMFGFGPGQDPVNGPDYIECFIKRAPPAALPSTFKLRLTVWPRKLDGRMQTLTLDVRHPTTMAQIKKLVMDSMIQGAVASIAELRMSMRGARERDASWDIADSLTIGDFYGFLLYSGAMECSFRTPRSGTIGDTDMVARSFMASVIRPLPRW